jgi:hypothetical protein
MEAGRSRQSYRSTTENTSVTSIEISETYSTGGTLAARGENHESIFALFSLGCLTFVTVEAGSRLRIVGIASGDLHAAWADVELLVPWILPPDAASAREPHEVPTPDPGPAGARRHDRTSFVGVAAYRRFEIDYPESNRGWTAKLVPLHQSMFGPIREKLWLLQASPSTAIKRRKT